MILVIRCNYSNLLIALAYTSTQDLSWQGAESKCSEYAGKLPSIHSAADNDKVKALHSDDTAIWIGMKKDWSNVLSWSDGTPVDYLNWGAGGEPSAGKCVFMEKIGTWSFSNCGEANDFICVK